MSFKLPSRLKKYRGKVVKFVQEFEKDYDSFSEDMKITINHTRTFDYDYDNDFSNKYYVDGYRASDILNKLFNNNNNNIDYVFDYNDYDGEVVSKDIIFSFTDLQFNKKIFCKIEMFDDLSPNRLDLFDFECNFYLNITYSSRLDTFYV